MDPMNLTLANLKSLSVGSIIVDRDGDPWKKSVNGKIEEWSCLGEPDIIEPIAYSPLKLLWEPGSAPPLASPKAQPSAMVGTDAKNDVDALVSAYGVVEVGLMLLANDEVSDVDEYLATIDEQWMALHR